jgi:hypothetical protein
MTTGLNIYGAQPQLQFNNPVFTPNEINVTVRRGIKWSGTRGNVSATGKSVCITDTKIIRFVDINQLDMSKEHDPDCREYGKLLEVMEKTYAGFDEKEIVTVVYFVVVS